MKAVMYGAGNIGRGFIAKRFFLSGAETTLIDVNADLINKLAEAGRYPIYVTKGTEYVPEWVENIKAINGRDEQAVIDTISDTDIVATALGVNVLPFVAPLLAKAIVARYNKGARPLNILICENLIGSDSYLRGLVEPHIPAELKDYFNDSIGFVCVSVCITVPPTPQKFLDENPLAVCTDNHNELPVDLAGFRPVGAPLPTIDSMVPFTPFSFFIERKLLIHNMGHALMAYYGRLKGYELISEIACDGEIKYVLTRALIESARALSKRHNVPLDDMMEFVENLMVRFENPLLIDDVFRVGRDTKRKLSKGDRLGGAFHLVREQGGVPAHIAIGIAAGLLFDHPDDAIGLEVAACARNEGVRVACEKYCSITADEDVALVERFYNLLAAKAPFADIVAALADYKCAH